MKKKWRIAITTLAIALTMIVLLSVVAIVLLKGTPSWYGTAPPTSVERDSLAQAAENKLIDAQNWAELLRADATRDAHLKQRGAATLPAPRAEGSYVIEFTQQELNALFDKWSTLYNWRSKYAAYFEDPKIILHNGRLILAAQLKEIGAIASFQFHPQVDDQGRLHLDLDRVMGGHLPLPDLVWTKWRTMIVTSLRNQGPRWQAYAKLDATTGSANFPAMAATLSRLVFAIADRQPADPILFLPLVDRGQAVPVRVMEVTVDDGKLTLVVEPLTPAERQNLFDRIRSPQ